MNRPISNLIVITAACAVIGLVPPAGLAGTPKIAAAAQVGNVAPSGMHHVFLLLQYLEGAAQHPAYAVWQKVGLPPDPGDYQRLAVIAPTLEAPVIQILLDRAAAAGFDNKRLEADLDGMLPPAAYGGIAQKLAAFLQANPGGGLGPVQREALRRAHPQVAVVEGRAFIARVPAGQVSTFEIRVIDPATEVEGSVVARVTSPASRALLPSPGSLSERVETTPRGHLRTHLRWCIPAELRELAFHWSGFHLFRVPRQAWVAAHQSDPPANLSRTDLLGALQSGLATQVNRSPVAPGTEVPCPAPPESDVFFITDDNDSAALAAFAPGSQAFHDGFEATYYVAATDHFGRVGHPSPGLAVRICDRLPPAAPSRVRVDNIYRQEGATRHALRVSWQREDAREIRRYHVFRFDNPDDVFVDRQLPLWPATAHRIAVINNTGNEERMVFVDQTPGASVLPADDGRTRWYVIVGEDNTRCPSLAGVGNLSGPSGPVPGALYDLAGPGVPGGGLRVPCCQFTVAQQLQTLGALPLRLVANRTHPRVAWVEFRDRLSGEMLGRHSFGTATQVVANPGFQGAGLFEARFGTALDQVSNWVGEFGQFAGPSYPEHRWTAGWACSPSLECDGGFLDPVDPGTGEIAQLCVVLTAPQADVVDVALFRRLGDDGPMVMQRRVRLDTDNDGVRDVTEICETAPPANPGRACYFLQYFDRNGNPSVVIQAGCVETPGSEGFPVPRITHWSPLKPLAPAPAEGQGMLAWFCPRPGVDRFEIAVAPPPPGAARVILEGTEAGVGVEWGVLDSPRLATGFGGEFIQTGGFGEDTPSFSVHFELESGKNYQARIRAVGPGEFGQRLTGAWSDPAVMSWIQSEVDPIIGGATNCPPPWPARAVPALVTDPSKEVDALLVNWSDFVPGQGFRPATELWIRMGCFLPGEVLVDSEPGQTTPQPPRVRVGDLEARLDFPLPFTVYLHQTAADGRGTMLQVSHYVDEILTTSPAAGELNIIDRSFAVRAIPSGAGQPPCLWFRVRQPLIAGRSYRCAVVLHGTDREPIEVLRTRTVPAVNPIQP